MEPQIKPDPASFKGTEQAGWDRGAEIYDTLLGSVTRDIVGPLLDATAVGPGTALLETCCGPGYGCGQAVARGATAVGIDFAPAMVAKARALHPRASFEEGDAERLRFVDASFDAVICPFGVNHLSDADAAIREVHRVLRPGGRFAFSMWCAPGRSKFHGLVLDSIRAHGNLDVPLPPAPPPFRFSDPAACRTALTGAAFVDVEVEEVPLVFRTTDVSQVIALTRLAIRLEMIIALQPPAVQNRIVEAIVAGAELYRSGALITLPMPALVARGTKSP